MFLKFLKTVQTKRKINKIFIHSLLFVGSLIAIVALYFLYEHRIIIGLAFLANLIFCVSNLWNDKTNSNSVISKERERAELAENYIKELQEYVAVQEKTNQSLRESKEKFRHAAFHDVLTSLPNRSLFIETLKFILEKHKQTPNYHFAILSLDLIRFKTINDSLGHITGDKLILKVAQRLMESLREGDLVARFGSDEFGIILNNISNLGEAVKFAELLKHKISAPFTIDERQVFSSASIGIAVGNRNYKEAEDVLRDADIAMYHAKESSSELKVFDDTMYARALNLLQLETDLRLALERHELCAYFQPIVGLDSMKLMGFESLIRWKHPERGLIPPSEFIPISEDTNLIVPITLWMLRHSCEQMVKWQNSSPNNKSLFLSVNLSGKHFAQKDLVSQVAKIIIETKIEPATLKLEITESAVMENAEMVIPMLRDLKNLGVQLSIDDFGTGYSSLSYLHRFPIDTLKVDRSFVSTMEDGSENGEIVRTIIALAKNLGMDIVAEGIETVHQLHQLRILDCEYGQGYLFSKPVPIEDAELLIAKKAAWQSLLPVLKVSQINPELEINQLGRVG